MSNVRSSNFSDLTATYGIKPDSTNGITISANGFDFRESGGCLYPLNKTKVVFTGTGADQSWVVPAGISYIFVKMWGAGGAHGRQSGWSFGAAGGGGGHTRGLISVTAGSTLTVKVGAGGRTAFNGSTYGGGGGATNATDTTYGGTGGGGTYLFSSSTLLLAAGGGGGGGTSRIAEGNVGGAGGGLIGQKGESPYDAKTGYGGTGGTQSAGGSSTSVGGVTVGSQYQGGQSGTNSYGGGGGGGYYGGGGGGYSESNTMGGGGGGSGYVIASAKLGGTFTGNLRIPAFAWDNDLDTGVSNYTMTAYGCQNLQNNIGAGVTVGGQGYLVIYY